MYRQLVTITLLILLLVSVTFAERIELKASSDDVTAVVNESNDSKIVLTFEVNGFEQTDLEINGIKHVNLSIGREGNLLNKGEPDLPRLCRSVIIPDNSHMSLRVVESEYIDYSNISVAPSKGNFDRTIDPNDVPYTFGPVYSGNDWYPADLVATRDPYILRDYRGLVVEVNAFRYNAASRTLRVYSSITVELVADGPGQINTLPNGLHSDKLVPAFDKIYDRHFMNYDQSRKYTPLAEFGDMLIITNDAFRAAMEPLVQWKLQKGIATTIVNISTIGNTHTAIKAYIQDFYDNNNLAWVLLVGDHAEITSPQASGGASDPSYSKLAGSDNYPEIFVGRFSAQSVADAETQVERTITYESNPVAGDWANRAIGIASTEGPGHYGEYDNEHMALIRSDLLGYGYAEVDQLYGPPANAAQVFDALNNDGRGWINYCGHGSTTAWSTTGFNNSNINALTNNNKLPFVISVGCVNGEFDGPTCFAETWLRATSGGEPTGAIATYMSSINQAWSPPMYAQDETVDLLIAEEMVTIGGLCYNGSMFMMDVVGASGVTEFNTWHIFGDPSLSLRTDTPAPLAVTHDPILLVSLTDFIVHVDGEVGALCALYYDSVLYGSAYTNLGGNATINLPVMPPVGAAVTVTVTAYNAMPYVSAVTVVTPEGPYVIYDQNQVGDLAGNNNGLVDFGESITLGVGLTNVGPDTAHNIEATLSTTDPYVTITDATESYGSIDPDWGVGFVADGFAFDVSLDAPDGHIIAFDIVVTGTARDTWTGAFQITVHAPVISLSNVLIDDLTGNNNGKLDPGETVSVKLTLSNSGSGLGTAVDGYISSPDPLLSVDDNYGFFGNIDPLTGSATSTVDYFELTADSACPVGYVVTMQLNLGDAQGYASTESIDITVGDRVAFFAEDFAFDDGWAGLGGPAVWTIGAAAGAGTDPSVDCSPTSDNMVLGNNLSGTGNYPNYLGTTNWIYSPVINCADMTGGILSYYHWLGIESSSYDHAYLEVYDGADWVTLYENPSSTVEETAWEQSEFDVSAYTDGNAEFQMRFGLGTTDGSVSFCGWNIDDILLRGYGEAGLPAMCEIADSALFVSVQQGTQDQTSLRVRNIGGAPLRISFNTDKIWLLCSSDELVIPSGDSIDMPVTLNCSAVPSGDYVGHLYYQSNAAASPAGNVPVYLHVPCCSGTTGNVNCDPLHVVDISDMTLLVNHLFVTFEELCCPAEANTSGDSEEG
ncbi:MAG: C25 family cysteine peptidase, partial [candidate division Zixibacteria bacterium]